MNIRRDYILTLPKHTEEKQLSEELPEFRKHFKAFKRERSQIERVFGLVLSKFMILQAGFKGRGPNRSIRLGQIFTLACQLTNLSFEFENYPNSKNVNIVDKNPPQNYEDLLNRCI